MNRAEHQPEQVELALYAGVFVKLWSVREAGTLLPQHAHEHPHLTLIMRGAVRAWRGEEMLGDYRAPAVIRIPADTLHNFLTLTNDVALACIHNADHLEGDEPAVSQEARLELED
jgi:quercetin dioxygenase-like cupin family protein